MRIEDLTSEQTLSLLVIAGGQQLDFSVDFLEAYPRKHMIVTTPVMKNDKIISFTGKGILIHLVVTFLESKPLVFQNVTVHTAKREDDSLCYTITTIAESKELNRRGAYRCYIGVDTYVRIGNGRSTIRATIKDVSVTGFAFAVTEGNREYEDGLAVHAVLNDYIEETMQSYSFHLIGSIVRHYELENGIIVYGCQMPNRVIGLDKYLNEKERMRLRKAHGTAPKPPKK